MRDFAIVFVHLIVTLARLATPGGLRSVVAESVLIRHQLLILNRGRKRAPNLRATDRIIVALCTVFMRPARVVRSAIVLKPSTLLHLHSVLRKRKYRMLFSPRHCRRPGPKGPNKDLIEAVVATKRRNPGWGCPRIAQQISLAFGVEIDKDVVRRVLSVHYRPESDSQGPSGLTFLGHTKDSLWSCDLFRCESATLRTHWVLVVMDQFTRRIIGFACTTASLMEWRCAVCSIVRFAGTVRPNISARITIRCIDSTNGRLIFGSSRSPKSRVFLTCRFRIPSWSDLSARFAASISTASYSGPQPIWKRR